MTRHNPRKKGGNKGTLSDPREGGRMDIRPGADKFPTGMVKLNLGGSRTRSRGVFLDVLFSRLKKSSWASVCFGIDFFIFGAIDLVRE